MRRLRLAAAFAVAVGLTLTPITAAHAVTNSATDPTGDMTGSATNDITNLSVTLDINNISIAITTAAALPARTNSSWGDDNTDGRQLALFLNTGAQSTDADGPIIGIDHTVSAVYADSNFDQKLCDSTTSIVGTTLTTTFPTSCLDNPGILNVTAELGDLTSDLAADVDFAIETGVSDTVNPTPVKVQVPGGYWLLGTDGGVFSYGDAAFYGSTGAIKLNRPVVGMSPQPDHLGYRFVASDGGVFAYGSAGFYGSAGAIKLNQPVVGMATTPSGHGYWLVASDGGIFAYGDANFYGSAGAIKLNKPIVSMSATASGHGYIFVASDGGVFNYGDAVFSGSGVSDFTGKTVVGMQLESGGYRLLSSTGDVRAYGTVFKFGDGEDLALNGHPANVNFVGIADRP